MAAYERKVHDLAEPRIAARLAAIRPGDEIPIIGGEFVDYELLAKQEPHIEFPSRQEYCANLQGMITRAMAARRWFELEAPAWAQPLPLKEEDCIAYFDEPAQCGRRRLVGRYGMRMRSAWWHRENVLPFEVFCADQLRPPGFW
jgi:hypothetical protein